MDINSVYSIKFHKPYDVKEIHQWILDNDGFKDDITDIPVFFNEECECISLEEFTARINPKGVYEVEESSIWPETFVDAMKDLAKKFPMLCFDAHLYFNDYNGGVCIVGDFSNKDGEYTEEISDGGYSDEDYYDEDYYEDEDYDEDIGCRIQIRGKSEFVETALKAYELLCCEDLEIERDTDEGIIIASISFKNTEGETINSIARRTLVILKALSELDYYGGIKVSGRVYVPEKESTVGFKINGFNSDPGFGVVSREDRPPIPMEILSSYKGKNTNAQVSKLVSELSE